jgi:hypothetical protein
VIQQAKTALVACGLVAASALAACSGAIGPSGSGTGSGSTAGPGSSGAAQSGANGSSGSSGVAAAACVPGLVNVGDAPMQRLTQDQYANSVRALLGLATVSTADMPSDEKLGVFASNVAVSVTDLAVDQYTTSAENVAKAALAQAKWDSLVPCKHATLGDDACAAQFVQTFGMRAFRRPLTMVEAARYTTEYKSFAASGYDSGIRVVVETMLQSPNFLYRPEVGAPNAAAGAAVLLTPFELASRLSFFLWNSTPDDTLLAAASANSLSDPSALQAQAQRMLADPRARDTIASFHKQWLDVTSIPTLTKDPATYPGFSPAVGAAMANETVDFADYVLRRGDGTLKTLLTAPFTIAGDALLPLYGATRPAGASAQDPLPLDPTQRAGILTQPSFLAVHAHANQSAPVVRGKIVRQNMICEPVPDPPNNVNTTPPDPSPNATTRQRFATHESVPSCAGCHSLIDPIGFGLENFDGIGQYRTKDGNLPVDASGSFVGTEDLNGTFDGAIALAKKLAASPEVQTCVTGQWLSYALGRTKTTDDACSLSRLVTSFNSSGQNMKQLLVDIVTADSFRYRTGGKS